MVPLVIYGKWAAMMGYTGTGVLTVRPSEQIDELGLGIVGSVAHHGRLDIHGILGVGAQRCQAVHFHRGPEQLVYVDIL